MNLPTISVVIPAYNCAGSLPYVLDGLFAQNVQPTEIIVVNDCSPDDLDGALQPYLSRIKYIKNPVNLGLSKTYNAGLSAATGEYLMTLHSDCVLDPDYIQKLLTILTEQPDVAVATGQYRFEQFEDLAFPDKVFSVVNALPVENDPSLPQTEEISFIEGKADLFRGDILRKEGFFNQRLVLTCEDQDLSARLRQRGFRIIQRHDCHFSVKFSGTQDSIRKVLKKQRTYARGQAYILMKFREQAVVNSSANRNFRVNHRLSQLLSALAVWALLPLAIFNRHARLLLAAVLAYRFVHYYQLGKPLTLRERLIVCFLGIACDSCYTAGLVEGALKTASGRSEV